jgi:hypothetical protein
LTKNNRVRSRRLDDDDVIFVQPQNYGDVFVSHGDASVFGVAAQFEKLGNRVIAKLFEHIFKCVTLRRARSQPCANQHKRRNSNKHNCDNGKNRRDYSDVTARGFGQAPSEIFEKPRHKRIYCICNNFANISATLC